MSGWCPASGFSSETIGLISIKFRAGNIGRNKRCREICFVLCPTSYEARIECYKFSQRGALYKERIDTEHFLQKS
jgi:hypothetical protein